MTPLPSPRGCTGTSPTKFVASLDPLARDDRRGLGEASAWPTINSAHNMAPSGHEVILEPLPGDVQMMSSLFVKVDCR